MALIDDNKNIEDDIIDVDISPIKKKRFRFNRDNNKILELNTSDITMLDRVLGIEAKLNELANEATNFNAEELKDNTPEGLEKLNKKLNTIDSKMRKCVDELFNAPVSSVCADDGSMYDIFDGKFRFEYVIDKIIGLYEDNISAEYSKLRNRMKSHTDKYVNKK